VLPPFDGFLQNDVYCSPSTGPLNVIIPFTAAAGIITLVWPLATSESSLIAISVVYGYVFLPPSPSIMHGL